MSEPVLCQSCKGTGWCPTGRKPDACDACGGHDHRSFRGRCSASYLAAIAVIDRGEPITIAAAAADVDVSSVRRTVKRLRDLRAGSGAS